MSHERHALGFEPIDSLLVSALDVLPEAYIKALQCLELVLRLLDLLQQLVFIECVGAFAVLLRAEVNSLHGLALIEQ